MTYKTVSTEEWRARLPRHVQETGQARGQELIAEYTLRQIRDAVNLTQTEVAMAAGTTQDQVSKIEHREDLMVSSLERHIAAMGGKLRLAVEFPDRPAVALSLKGRVMGGSRTAAGSSPKRTSQG